MEGTIPTKHYSSLATIIVATVTLGGLIIYKLIFCAKKTKESLITLIDPRTKYPLKLIRKENLTHDTLRLRFTLPTPEHFLGIGLGNHIFLTARINGELVIRPYTPISSVDAKGYFEIVIKVYRPNEVYPNGGKMSQYLESLKLGDEVDVRGPTGRMVYKRNGILELKFDHKSPPVVKWIKHIGMIAGGTGITPMFQLIKDICYHKEDKTKLSLVFSNKTEEDILLHEELDTLASENPRQFDVWYTVTQSGRPEWNYDKGRISEAMLRKRLPAPGADVLILVCGPSGMVNNACLPNLELLGYTKEMIFVC